LKKVSADKIPGDDEEHVDSGEASGQPRRECVMGDDRQHGQCAQPFDVVPDSGAGSGELGFQNWQDGILVCT
jgi:hypothetical protein